MKSIIECQPCDFKSAKVALCTTPLKGLNNDEVKIVFISVLVVICVLMDKIFDCLHV